MKTILCYGDSNTWGCRPDSTERFGHDVRWPRVLQKLLGDEYYVVENGLNARTTNLDDEGADARNGLHHLPVAVKSNAPLDVCIIMLGTNDLKARFNRSAEEIANAVGGLVDEARALNTEYATRPLEVIVLAPVVPNSQAPTFAQWGGDFDDSDKARKLCEELSRVAVAKNCRFVDVNQCAEVGEDGLHLTQRSHEAIAQKLAKEVQTTEVSTLTRRLLGKHKDAMKNLANR